MAQPKVWLRPDPVGSRPSALPTRDEFRRRHARRSLVAGCYALGFLGALLLLEVLGVLDRLWNPLHALAFCFGLAGVGGAAIAMRTPQLRPRAAAGLGISLVAVVGALFVDGLVDRLG